MKILSLVIINSSHLGAFHSFLARCSRRSNLFGTRSAIVLVVSKFAFYSLSSCFFSRVTGTHRQTTIYSRCSLRVLLNIPRQCLPRQSRSGFIWQHQPALPFLYATRSDFLAKSIVLHGFCALESNGDRKERWNKKRRRLLAFILYMHGEPLKAASSISATSSSFGQDSCETQSLCYTASRQTTIAAA